MEGDEIIQEGWRRISVCACTRRGIIQHRHAPAILDLHRHIADQAIDGDAVFFEDGCVKVFAALHFNLARGAFRHPAVQRGGGDHRHFIGANRGFIAAPARAFAAGIAGHQINAEGRHDAARQARAALPAQEGHVNRRRHGQNAQQLIRVEFRGLMVHFAHAALKGFAQAADDRIFKRADHNGPPER